MSYGSAWFEKIDSAVDSLVVYCMHSWYIHPVRRSSPWNFQFVVFLALRVRLPLIYSKKKLRVYMFAAIASRVYESIHRVSIRFDVMHILCSDDIVSIFSCVIMEDRVSCYIIIPTRNVSSASYCFNATMKVYNQELYLHGDENEYIMCSFLYTYTSLIARACVCVCDIVVCTIMFSTYFFFQTLFFILLQRDFILIIIHKKCVSRSRLLSYSIYIIYNSQYNNNLCWILMFSTHRQHRLFSFSLAPIRFTHILLCWFFVRLLVCIYRIYYLLYTATRTTTSTLWYTVSRVE